MLVKIEKPIIFKTNDPIELKFDDKTNKNIKDYWNEFLKNNKNYWDGDIFVASDIDLNNNVIKISKTKFSSYIFSKYTEKIEIKEMFAGILFKTKDGKYVIIKNNHNNLNIIGGLVDYQDFKNNSLIPDLCIEREVKEEIGIDLNDKTKVLDYSFKYIKVPSSNGEIDYSVGMLYTGILNFTSEEFKKYMDNNTFDNEIVNCYFFSSKEILDLKLNKKDDIFYIKEFITLEEQLKE